MTGEKKRLPIKAEYLVGNTSSSEVKMKIKRDDKTSNEVTGAALINANNPLDGPAIKARLVNLVWLAFGKVLNCS